MSVQCHVCGADLYNVSRYLGGARRICRLCKQEEALRRNEDPLPEDYYDVWSPKAD